VTNDWTRQGSGTAHVTSVPLPEAPGQTVMVPPHSAARASRLDSPLAVMSSGIPIPLSDTTISCRTGRDERRC
jgi:hypothetical protein